MSGHADPVPGCGRICEQMIPRMLLEIARVRARGEALGLPACEVPTCRATNPIVLGKGRHVGRCYRHGVNAREGHHPKTDHTGPEIPGTDANEHRVLSEVERIWKAISLPGMCLDCALGLNRFLAVRLTALGSLGDAA